MRASSWDRPVTAGSARASCQTAKVVLATTTGAITTVSERSPVTIVTVASTNKTRTSGSRSAEAIRRHTRRGATVGVVLGP